MSQQNNNTYSGIFKSTFLFGLVQGFSILSKVGIFKAVAYFLGADGMGLISLYQSTINILRTLFDLGVSQSVVRDIAQNTTSPQASFSRIVTITKKIIVFTAFLGSITTVIMSKVLSVLTFDSEKYTYAFAWLSIVVGLNIINESQLGILKGMRQLKALAKASIMGSVVGLIVAVPFFCFMGEEGIIPSLIVTALAATLFSYHYVNRIDCDKQKVSTITALKEGSLMIKMGVALMYVSFLGVLSDYIVRAFIGFHSTLEMVGLFQAGAAVITSYFGVVITALTTDYYPRISAINQDNLALEKEFNKQAEVGLIIISPLIILFLFFQHLFIKILYTDAFIQTLDYLEFAVFGVLLTICSNALGMILLAKRDTKVFFFTATIGRFVIVGVSLLFYYYWGLTGLGIAYAITGFFHLLLMQGVLWYNYKICIRKNLAILMIMVIVFSVLGFFISKIDCLIIKCFSGVVLMGVIIKYTLSKMKTLMGIDVLNFVKMKINK